MEYTIRDLLKIVSLSDVARILDCVYYYDSDKRFEIAPYHRVVEELRTYDKVIPNKGDELVITASEMDGDEKRWYSISLIKNDGVNYGIDFMDWKELMDIPISASTIEHYTSEDIVVHFLWEITFFGYSREDIANKSKEIMSRADEEPLTKLEVQED